MLQVRYATDGSLQRTLYTSNAFPLAFAFSPDGRSLAISSWLDGIEILNWPSGELRYRIPDSWPYDTIAFSPDGQSLAVGGGYYFPAGVGVKVWRTTDGQPQPGFDEHAGKIEKLV